MLNIQITGLDAVRARIVGFEKHANFAASKALNNAAYGVNKQVKAEMQGAFQGGATAYALRAFSIDRASKEKLEATVMLRTDANGGTPHSKTLAHLFTGGSRQWKKFEGLIRASGYMPSGTIAVPGKAMRLDSRGNMSRAQLTEIFGALRNGMQVVRTAGRSKQVKAVGYFVLSKRHGRLPPGIYKRVTTGGWVSGGSQTSASGVQPMVMFVRMGTWRKYIDLDSIARQQLSGFVADFNAQLRQALATAR